ncbi:hypothetical protein AB0L74_16505 [Streptomyces sp. NPDC052020]|uniref:hypothetical protein n=1 Tax=Streptomyces sp. NPDC052020 TaxID=3155677 RepID=UPI0034126FB8
MAAADFQTGVIPEGFAFDQDGNAIDLTKMVVVLPPPANSGLGWGSVWFSVGADFGDVRLRVATFVNGAWAIEFWDVPRVGNRVTKTLPTNVQKISVGRAKKTGTDLANNAPVSWLLEAALQ